MAERTLKTIVALRRDTEDNFSRIAASFKPLKGEVLFIDTAEKGLRAKVGNGEDYLIDLPYSDELVYEKIDSVVVHGYYLRNTFYTDSTYLIECEKSLHKLYIDVNTDKIYSYDGSKYVSVNETLPTATEDVSGIMKLYSEKGQHTDGTMTQKEITDNLNTKFEVSVDEDEECAIFTITM